MLLIENAFLVTMNPRREVFTDGAVAVEGNAIAGVGRTEDLRTKYPQAARASAKRCAVIPGLVSAHAHLFQSLCRGIGTDLPLADWLEKCIWPLAEELGREESAVGALLASAEMLRTGTTTFVDSHYVHKDKGCLDGIAEAVERIGIRGELCRTCVDGERLAAHFRETPEQVRRESARVIEKYHGSAGGRVTVRVEPLNEQLASSELIKTVYEISQEYGVGMSMHLAETSLRAAWTRQRYGCSPLEYLQELGVLGPHLLLAHCVWITAKDIEWLRATDTRVAHNAVSNQYLADGVAPVPEMLAKGVCVALGPDGAASNNNLDMFGAMKAAVLMQRANRLEMTRVDAHKALEMATIDGARAIGKEAEIGSLERGKKADLVLVDLDRAEMAPDLGTVSNLVYSASGYAVRSVMVDGKWVVENGKLTTVDESKLIAESNATVARMVKDARVDERMYRGNWQYIS